MRVTGWEAKLHGYIDECKSKPFTWGRHDCALFVGGWIEIALNRQVLTPFLGKYASLNEGIKLLKSLGYKNQINYFMQNFEEIPVAMAATGDVVVIKTNESELFSLGIVSNEHVLVVQPENAGLGLLGLMQASRAFRIQ